jgi:colicin import membrane protein
VSNIKEHKEGIFFTTLFHAVLLFILLYFGFYTPLPLPAEKGILVDFGYDNNGSGMVEPPKQNTQTRNNASRASEAAPQKPSETQPSDNDPGTEKIMTQDYEKTVGLDEGKKKADLERKKKLEEERKLKDKQNREKQAERQKILAEQKRVKDSIDLVNKEKLAEQRRIDEQRRNDSLKKAEQDAKAAAINSRTKNAFGSGASGSSNNSGSQGQGATYGTGNQGSPDGTPGANQYGEGGGEGVSFNLSGRSLRSLVKPTYSENEAGIVIVAITVDKNGNVTTAVAGSKGTTSMNQNLWQASVKAALATKFNSNVNAPALQKGTITYRFVLN